MRRARWCLIDEQAFLGSSVAATFPPLLARALWAHGLQTVEICHAWLNVGRAPLPPWQAVPNMPAAVQRVAAAVRNQQPVAVFGDYDVDGLTATAIVVQTLQAFDVPVAWNIPDRVEGYGLNSKVVATMATWLHGRQRDGRPLLVVVDCGTSNRDEVAQANAAGLDVVILDHHTVSDGLPAAHTVVNPKGADRDAPFRELTAAGLACYLARGLLASETGLPEPPGREALKRSILALAALGTTADVAPLVADNRAIVSWGLRAFRHLTRPGLPVLLRVAGADSGPVTADTLGWRLAPRLNAAGRMDQPTLALRLLLTDRRDEALLLAAELDSLNRQRQTALETMLTEARGLLSRRVEQRVAVITGDGWRPGLVGLVAGRLAEEIGKPTIVLTRDGAQARGSARSHADFNITHALTACRQLLARYGGHHQAAGLSLASHQIEALAEQLDVVARDFWPQGPPDTCIPVAGTVTLADLSPDAVAELAAMEPFGEGNKEPLWLLRGLRVVEARTVGNGGAHLRLVVGDGSATRSAIAFRMGARRAEVLAARRLDVLCVARLDTWQGVQRADLQVRDLRPAEA